MPLPGRIFADDEELGKKNDDHRPANGTIPMPAWSWTRWRATPKMRRRRLLVGIVVGVILYFFFQNIPTDLAPIAQRIDLRIPGRTFNGVPLGPKLGSSIGQQAPSGQPPYPEGYAASEKPYYNGQIKFYSLAVSLHGIAKTMGYRDQNKNVLFAAGSLQSAARLIPMACEMSRWNRNTVHFMFVGRDDLPMEDIILVNGVTPECDIFWHGEDDNLCYPISTDSPARCSPRFFSMEYRLSNGTVNNRSPWPHTSFYASTGVSD